MSPSPMYVMFSPSETSIDGSFDKGGSRSEGFASRVISLLRVLSGGQDLVGVSVLIIVVFSLW